MAVCGRRAAPGLPAFRLLRRLAHPLGPLARLGAHPRVRGPAERAGRWARLWIEALLDALAPPLCVLCRAPPGALPWLCPECLARLRLIGAGVCLRCGAPLPIAAPLCARCPAWSERLLAARSAAPHVGTARDLVHALKYRRELAAALPLGHLVASAARRLQLPPDVTLVPVPLHPRRYRRRGFNQAAEIARVASRELRLPLRPRWLRRVRDAPPSVHRSVRGRLRAARGAFRAAPAVRGRSILLVDDVLTSGATLGSCTAALGRRGVSRVWAVTATRAAAPG